MTNQDAALQMLADKVSKQVPVRLPVEMIKRIDQLRDPLIPRAAYVRDLLGKALAELERKDPPHQGR
jgi:predicted DNA-binding protein